MLKNALFRGGLAEDTLKTLISGEVSAAEERPPPRNSNTYEQTFIRPQPVPVTIGAQRSADLADLGNTLSSDGGGLARAQPQTYTRASSFGQVDSSIDTPDKDDDLQSLYQRVPLHDQRTILISNLSDRTTHKDLVEIIRGGRLLDIFLRNDRTATVSFVEGAQDFLAHAKKNDIYLHTKRVSPTTSAPSSIIL
jgi:hypothetical protein